VETPDQVEVVGNCGSGAFFSDLREDRRADFEQASPSPSTHLKSPVARAIIWNKELDSLALYKASNHHYRAIRSWAVLVGVLETPSFVPGLFLWHAPSWFGRSPNPHLEFWLCSESHFSLGLPSQGWRRCSADSPFLLTDDAMHYGVS
jgi:hypothetical protein